MPTESRPFSAAAERNRIPIGQVLERGLPGSGTLLEIGAGTGQHALYLSRLLPGWRWLPSEHPSALEGLRQGLAGESPENLDEPIELDVTGDRPRQRFDAIYSDRGTCTAGQQSHAGIRDRNLRTMSSFSPVTFESWQTLASQARALLAGERDRIANAANLAALVHHTVPDLNWTGFYFVDGDDLVVGPFQGLPACVRIGHGRGVCGTAWASRRTQRVADVQEFDGHIACDSTSRSEIVVPLALDGTVFGVLDIDSPKPDRFDAADQAGIEALARIYVESVAG